MMYLSHLSLNFACRGQSWICLICSLIHGEFELSGGRPTRGTLDTLPVGLRWKQPATSDTSISQPRRVKNTSDLLILLDFLDVWGRSWTWHSNILRWCAAARWFLPQTGVTYREHLHMTYLLHHISTNRGLAQHHGSSRHHPNRNARHATLHL